MTEDDDALARSLARPPIRIGNKADRVPDGPGLRVSALEGSGLDSVRQEIARALEGVEDGLPLSARQASALTDAATHVDAAVSALEGRAGPSAPELAAVELRAVLASLARLTGETVESAVLDELFSRFCIGK